MRVPATRRCWPHTKSALPSSCSGRRLFRYRCYTAEPALGYRIGTFAYLTDCSAIPEQSLELLQGLELLIIDGLRWTEHPYHFNIPGAIAAARQIGTPRTILTHLTHQIAYSEESKLPPGFELAYDGMEFDLR